MSCRKPVITQLFCFKPALCAKTKLPCASRRPVRFGEMKVMLSTKHGKERHSMTLGFLTSKLEDIELAAQLGFTGVELGTGALAAGTSAEREAKLEQARALCAKTGIEVTAIAFYDISWSSEVQADPLPGYLAAFEAAEALGVKVISSMSGFDASLDWDGNLELFQKRFTPISEAAGEKGLRIALENWVSVGGPPPQRPINFGGSPAIWDALFERVPSEALGLEFDPSHLYWQGIDHVRALKQFAGRVYHVHAKDTEMLPEERYRWGHYGSSYRFRIPGYGAIDWTQFIGTLNEIGYEGGVAIEHEDPVYTGERFVEGLRRGHDVLYPLFYPGVKR